MTSIMATIIGEREEEFKDVFGTATVPVQSSTPIWGLFRAGRAKAFVLDYKALPEDQRLKLAQRFALDFGWSNQQARQYLTQPGLLIPAADCVISVFDSPRISS